MRRPKTIGRTLSFVASASLLMAASPSSAPSIVDRYALADLYLRGVLPSRSDDTGIEARFTDDGAGVLYQRGPAGDRTFYFVAVADGVPRVVTRMSRIIALLSRAGGEAVDLAKVRLIHPDFTASSGTFTFSIEYQRWALGNDGKLTKEDSAPSSGTSLSPAGRYEVFTRGYNLIARDRLDRREVALTTDGTRERPYGCGIAPLADILRENTEEPSLPQAVSWSPDGRFIATCRIDLRGVAPLSLTQQNPTGSFYPRSFHYIYPLAGARVLPKATRYAIDVQEAMRRGRANVIPLRIPAEDMLKTDPPDLFWQGDMLRAERVERGFAEVAIYRADPITGAAAVVARERQTPNVTVTSSFFAPAPELGGELSVSERTGWAQLYLVRPDDPDGGIPLTRGAWEVIAIDRIDAARREVLVTGVGRERDRSPYFRALYRIGLDARAPVLLTPEPFDHAVQLSPDGDWFIDAMSSPTTPTVTVLRSTRDGRILAELARADDSTPPADRFGAPESFRGVAADGRTPLHGMIWRPRNFDPSRRYPIIEAVYTSPLTTSVATRWNDAVRSPLASIAQIGAIVVAIDARGTARRGRAFRMHAFQNMGEVGLDDHITMIRQMARRYTYMDVSRVGVYGISAGGYDAARFILRRPSFYRVAVAAAGNHDLRLDKAWWPEASMGNAPPEVWERNSNMSVAGQLRGKLLLIHGEIDDNVPVTETMRLASAIIAAGRDVDTVILPNTGHNVYQPFFWRKLRDYFTIHLLGETPPPMSDPVTKPLASR